MSPHAPAATVPADGELGQRLVVARLVDDLLREVGAADAPASGPRGWWLREWRRDLEEALDALEHEAAEEAVREPPDDAALLRAFGRFG